MPEPRYRAAHAELALFLVDLRRCCYFPAQIVNIVQAFKTRVWHDTDHVGRQLKGVGRVGANHLVAAKLTTYARIISSSPSALEMAMSRTAPYGSGLLKDIRTWPDLRMVVTPEETPTGTKIKIEISATDPATIMDSEKHVDSWMLSASSGTEVVFFHRIYLWQLRRSGDATAMRCFWINTEHDAIDVRLKPINYSGLDKLHTLPSTVVAAKFNLQAEALLEDSEDEMVFPPGTTAPQSPKKKQVAKAKAPRKQKQPVGGVKKPSASSTLDKYVTEVKVSFEEGPASAARMSTKNRSAGSSSSKRPPPTIAQQLTATHPASRAQNKKRPTPLSTAPEARIAASGQTSDAPMASGAAAARRSNPAARVLVAASRRSIAAAMSTGTSSNRPGSSQPGGPTASASVPITTTTSGYRSSVPTKSSAAARSSSVSKHGTPAPLPAASKPRVSAIGGFLSSLNAKLSSGGVPPTESAAAPRYAPVSQTAAGNPMVDLSMFAYGKVDQVQQIQHGAPRKRQIASESDVYHDQRPPAPQKWHHQQPDRGGGSRPGYGYRQPMSGDNLWGGDTQPIFELGDFGGGAVTGQPPPPQQQHSDDQHAFGSVQPEHRYQDAYDDYGTGRAGYHEQRCNPRSLLVRCS